MALSSDSFKVAAETFREVAGEAVVWNHGGTAYAVTALNVVRERRSDADDDDEESFVERGSIRVMIDDVPGLADSADAGIRDTCDIQIAPEGAATETVVIVSRRDGRGRDATFEFERKSHSQRLAYGAKAR